jgi:hypothetical protein
VIEVLTSLTVILYILITLSMTVIIGYVSTRLLVKGFGKLFKVRLDVALEGTLEKLFAYSALGFAFIIIYGLILSVFRLLNQVGLLLLVAFLMMAELIFLMNQRIGGKSIIASVRGFLGKTTKGIAETPTEIFIIATFAIGIVLYFSPAIMLASYPGGDDRAYLFVTKLIVDNGTAFSVVNYPYAYPYMDHILYAGFEVIASFFYILLQIVGLPTTIPVIHLFLSLLFFSLVPISIYILTRGLLKNKGFAMCVASMSLFAWPALLFYFYWGGLGESAGFFLVPVFGLVDYKLNHELAGSGYKLRVLTGVFIAKSAMLALAAYVHIYMLYFFLFLVVLVIPLWTIMNSSLENRSGAKTKVKTYLTFVSPYLIIIVGGIASVVAAMTILRSIGSYNFAISRLYSLVVSNPQQILTDPLQIEFTVGSLVFRGGYGLDYAFVTFVSFVGSFCGGGVWVLLVLYFCSTVYIRRLFSNRKGSFYTDVRRVIQFTFITDLTAILFFLLSQNSPFGWYYVPLPLTDVLFPIRLYYELSLFFVFAEAMPIYIICVYIRNSPNRTAVNKASRPKPTRSHLKHKITKEVIATVFVVTIMVTAILPVAYDYEGSYVSSTRESVVSPNDLDAFRWIESNTQTNARFFVNLADAGGYIYVYTGRIVLPPNAMRAWNESSEISVSFQEILNMLLAGNITQQLVQQLRSYNISYVYVGERNQYENPPFDITALTFSPYFTLEFREGGAYVFRITNP